MANITINDASLALLAAGDIAADDMIPVWDASAAAQKRATRAAVVGATITGGGTINTAGKTFAVPADGTAALIEATNTYAQPQIMPAVARQIAITINDDSVFSFAAPLYGLLVINSRRTQNPNIACVVNFTSAGPLCTIMAQPSTQVEVSTSILTGTTGTDGKFTVSLNANGSLYLENRTGTSAIISLTILGG